MAFGNDPTTGTFSPTQGNEDAILKDLFSPDGVTDQFFYNNPFLAMIEKDENAGGRTYDQPVWGGFGQAQGSQFGINASGTTSGGASLGLQAAAGVSGEQPFVYLVPKGRKHCSRSN